MKKFMNNLISKIFNWIFSKQIKDIDLKLKKIHKYHTEVLAVNTTIQNLLGNTNIAVDVQMSEHQYSPSWAVVSIQGERTDYLKFMNLDRRTAHEIHNFLRQFDRINHVNIDMYPNSTPLMMLRRK